MFQRRRGRPSPELGDGICEKTKMLSQVLVVAREWNYLEFNINKGWMLSVSSFDAMVANAEQLVMWERFVTRAAVVF